MNWMDLVRMSSSNLRRRKLRTFLTVLGVVIGTASIVIMLSLGIGMQESMYENMADGGGLMAITVMQRQDEKKKAEPITDDTVKNIARIPHVDVASPVINIDGQIIKGRQKGFVSFTGMSEDALRKMGFDLKEGGKIPKKGSFESVVGNSVILSLAEDYWETEKLPDIDFRKDTVFLTFGMGDEEEGGLENGPGPKARPPKKHRLQVSGFMAGKPDAFTMTSSGIYFEVSGLKRVLEKEYQGRVIPGQPERNGRPLKRFTYPEAQVFVDDVKNVEDVQAAIQDMGYEAQSNKEFIDQMKKSFAVAQAVLGGIGAISLLVAAIGIANNMMMSIYERTKEIGVIKVLGCDMRDIRRMFLLEAGYIGLLGGVIGNLLSFLASRIINVVAKGVPGVGETAISVIPPWLAALSTVFAIFIAMLAGFFPARRAMKLSPLAAISNE